MVGHNISVPDAGSDSASHFSLTHPNASNISLRNPLPLSAAQEAQVKDTYYRNVRNRCQPEIAAFAKCAKGRTVTATFMCREERLKMNGCMIRHATREEEDKAREEWFHGIQARRREREEKERAVEVRRAEVIELTRQKAEEERLEAEGKTKSRNPEKKGWW